MDRTLAKVKAERINLHLCVDPGHVARAAAALQQQLPPSQWETLAGLAAEIVARREAQAAGTTILVVPVSALESEVVRAVQAAGLPVTE